MMSIISLLYSSAADTNKWLDGQLWQASKWAIWPLERIGWQERGLVIQLILSGVTLCSVSFILFLIKRHKRHQLFKELAIPGPATNIFDGNLSEYLTNDAHFEIDLDWAKRFGPLHGFYLGGRALIQLSHPRLIQQVFVDYQTLPADRVQAMTKEINSGILFVKEPRWKTMRKTIQPTFSRYRIKGEDAAIQIETTMDKMMNYLKDKSARHNEGPFQIDVMALMKSTAMNLISILAFNITDRQVSEDDVHVEQLEGFLARSQYGGITAWSMRLPFLKEVIRFVLQYITMGPFLNNLMAYLEVTIDNGLKAIRDDTKTKDETKQTLLDSMIEMHSNGQLTRLEVMGNVLGILVAGYDTTSTTVSCLLWILAKHPDIQDRLRKELLEYGQESVWFESLMHETMRLYPVAVTFTQRRFRQDIELDVEGLIEGKTTLTIPKGVVFVYNAWVSNRDPSYWDRPDELIPERFIDETTGAINQKLVQTLAAFGFGRHICIGQNLAHLEIKSIITNIILNYRVRLIEPQTLRLVSSAKILSKPEKKIKLYFESVNHQRN